MLKEITRVMLGPFEHQVLEEVGEAALTALLVLGTHVIPKVYCHKRELGLVADDHVEPVFQGRLGATKVVQGGRVNHGCESAGMGVAGGVSVTGGWTFPYYGSIRRV